MYGNRDNTSRTECLEDALYIEEKAKQGRDVAFEFGYTKKWMPKAI